MVSHLDIGHLIFACQTLSISEEPQLEDVLVQSNLCCPYLHMVRIVPGTVSAQGNAWPHTT